MSLTDIYIVELTFPYYFRYYAHITQYTAVVSITGKFKRDIGEKAQKTSSDAGMHII